MDKIDEETVVAHGQASAQSRVPEITGAGFILGPVRSSDISRAGQLVLGIVQLGGISVLGRRSGYIDVPVGSFKLIGKPTVGVVDSDRPLGKVGGASGRAPVPAVAADFAAVKKIVERNELPRQLVVIRSYCIRK